MERFRDPVLLETGRCCCAGLLAAFFLLFAGRVPILVEESGQEGRQSRSPVAANPHRLRLFPALVALLLLDAGDSRTGHVVRRRPFLTSPVGTVISCCC